MEIADTAWVSILEDSALALLSTAAALTLSYAKGIVNFRIESVF